MNHIAVIPGWYPSRMNPLDGDFVQRHCRAISLRVPVTVIYPVKDSKIKKIKKEISKQGNLTEIILYYPGSDHPSPWEKLRSVQQYTRLVMEEFHKTHANIPFDFIHLHVLQKNAIPAYYLSRKYKIPLLVTEHSAHYLPESAGYYTWKERLWRCRIFAKAKSVHFVSHYLNAVVAGQCSGLADTVVIPNVVDTEKFYPAEGLERKPCNKFLHVSSLDTFQKDPERMIRIFSRVAEQRKEASLTIAGPEHPELKKWVKHYQMPDRIKILGAISYQEVAAQMRSHDALVLLSQYETFGCVVIEAQASGLPVLASDIPPLRELITSHINGELASLSDEENIVRTWVSMIDKPSLYNRKEIASAAAKTFNYSKVADQFMEWFASLKA